MHVQEVMRSVPEQARCGCAAEEPVTLMARLRRLVK